MLLFFSLLGIKLFTFDSCMVLVNDCRSDYSDSMLRIQFTFDPLLRTQLFIFDSLLSVEDTNVYF